MTLPSGTVVGVQKFSWPFQQWAGAPIDDRIRKRYGRKPVIDSHGQPLFAELAIIPLLKRYGLEDAIWADNYGRCFRNAMPFAECPLPEPLWEPYGRIVARNGGCSGCWDVIGWNNEGVMFVECKWKGRQGRGQQGKGKDRMKPNAIKWLQSALNAGTPLERFAICEWELR